MKIILLESNARNSTLLTKTLKNYNYQVEIVGETQTVLELVRTFNYDLLLLNLIFSQLDTISLCRQIRLEGYQMPVMILGVDDYDEFRVQSLTAGADDYITKPIKIEELIARIQAVLRRVKSVLSPVLTWENLQFDTNSREISYNGKRLHLTPKEYGLLELFLLNPRKVFSRSDLLNSVWLSFESPGEEAVTTQIRGLRQKLKAAGMNVDLIETVYGVGYRLREEDKKKDKNLLPVKY
jgi:DNA-binding response OmpR family regulator